MGAVFSKMNEGMINMLTSMKESLDAMQLSLDNQNNLIAELSAKFDKFIEFGKKQKVPSIEEKPLESCMDENKRLKGEIKRLKDQLAIEKLHSDEHLDELKNIKPKEIANPKHTRATLPAANSKMTPEPRKISKPLFSVPRKAPVPTRLSFGSRIRSTATIGSDFAYKDIDRLKTVQARNSQNVPHLRSHYAVERDSGFSPLETMMFD